MKMRAWKVRAEGGTMSAEELKAEAIRLRARAEDTAGTHPSYSDYARRAADWCERQAARVEEEERNLPVAEEVE